MPEAEKYNMLLILERKRYYEIEREWVVELDAALKTAMDRNYFIPEEVRKAGKMLVIRFTKYPI